MGEGDAWPGHPGAAHGLGHPGHGHATWVGHLSSGAQRLLERLDGELSETDESGRPLITGKVAVTTRLGGRDDDLDEIPEGVASTDATLAAHLARLLTASPYS